jgi:hypothetical protein
MAHIDSAAPPDAEFSGQEFSLQQLDRLSSAFRDLAVTKPEIAGFTCYGSVSRGEAGPDSDVDMFAFVEVKPDAPMQKNVMVGESGILRTSEPGANIDGTFFHPGIAVDYTMAIQKACEVQGIADIDVDVLPISPELVDSQVSQILADTKKYQGKKIGFMPRNIRGLFHVPVGEDGLRSYQAAVINRLTADPNGEAAWRMIRHVVAGFEKGRAGQDQEVEHRDIPKTLAEAQAFYAG